MDIKEINLPARVLAFVDDHYKGKSITEAAKITMANSTKPYEAEVDGWDVIFDANGEFIKEVKD